MKRLAADITSLTRSQMLDSILGPSPVIKTIQSRAAEFLHNFGFDANRATIAGALTGAAAGITLAFGGKWIAIGLLAISAAFDAVDGTIARQFGNPSAFGGIIDMSSDRLVEVAVLAGAAWTRPELYFPAMLLALSWYLNITIFLAVGAALERSGPKLIDYPPGLLERSEALVFFALLILLRPAGPLLCYAFTVLEIVTAVQRLRFGYLRTK